MGYLILFIDFLLVAGFMHHLFAPKSRGKHHKRISTTAYAVWISGLGLIFMVGVFMIAGGY